MNLDFTRRSFLQQVIAGATLILPRTGFAIRRSVERLSGSSLHFRFEPLHDLYFLLRKELEQGSTMPPQWRPAIDRMRQAAEYLPARAGLSLMNGVIAEHSDSAALVRTAERMPETGAGGVQIRAAVNAITDALRIAEPLYAGRIGSERRKIVEEAWHDRVDGVLLPKERECLSFLLAGLEIPDPSFEVPVSLVADAPDPGSITSRSRRLTAVCFVGIVPHLGTSLLEVILHEATHALEVAAGSDTVSVLDRLRSELQAKGVQPTDALFRDVPHTLMFVHSGETVRRLLDSAHLHYGDSEGYYAKVPVIAPAVRRHWIDRLNGQASADAAIERIVSDVLRDVGQTSGTA